MFRTYDETLELSVELRTLLSPNMTKTPAESAESFETRIVNMIEREMATRRAARQIVLVLKD